MTSIHLHPTQKAAQNVFHERAKKTEEEENISSAVLRSLAPQDRGTSLQELDLTLAMMQEKASSLNGSVLSTMVPLKVENAVARVLSSAGPTQKQKIHHHQDFRSTSQAVDTLFSNKAPYVKNEGLLSFGDSRSVESCLEEKLSTVSAYLKEKGAIQNMAFLLANSKVSPKVIDEISTLTVQITPTLNNVSSHAKTGIKLNLDVAAKRCAADPVDQ